MIFLNYVKSGFSRAGLQRKFVRISKVVKLVFNFLAILYNLLRLFRVVLKVVDTIKSLL